MREYKRAFKASQKMMEKVKQIPNCKHSFAEYFLKCAEFCYFYNLPKKATEYFEISFKLVESPLESL